MMKHFCDICGREMNNLTYFYRIQLVEFERKSKHLGCYDGSATNNTLTNKAGIGVSSDVCKKCYEDIMDSVISKIKAIKNEK